MGELSPRNKIYVVSAQAETHLSYDPWAQGWTMDARLCKDDAIDGNLSNG